MSEDVPVVADGSSSEVAPPPYPDVPDAAGLDAAGLDVAGPDIAGSQPAEPQSAKPEPGGAAPRKKRFWTSLTLPGSWTGLIFACLSFTPSLLPRGGLLQGLIAGISGVIGYGFGVTGAWVWRAFADRDPRPGRRRSWQVFGIVGVLLFALAFGMGQYWQHQIRQLMGVTDYSLLWAVLSPLVAALTFLALLEISRGIRWLYRLAVRLLDRWFGERAAKATGWIGVAALTYLVISGVLLDGFVSIANDMFSVRNGNTDTGVTQPTTDLRSGGPGSLIPWDTLGRQGRKFTGLGPNAAEIQAVTHQSATEPIRIYSGLESAKTAEERAALAVADLEHAGGFGRKYLLVFTTTGSGWVDPAAADSFEYLTGGDSAIVTMQYSYLPSWLSFLVDQSKAREAGRALFDAVYDKWSKMPMDSRPQLIVAGESLGSFGGETAFSGEYDMSNRTSGTLFVGPPNFNTQFRYFEDNRDPGSLEVSPIYKNGRIVRFSQNGTDYPPAGASWDGTRVVYLMHPSDPIVWWSPNLLFHRPDWLTEPRGSDVLGSMVWMPVVTFWQVTADLPFATGVPGGHGHKYTGEYVDAWNGVLHPSGVSTDELDAIRKAITGG
jgi:uncharacterized membrane protein